MSDKAKGVTVRLKHYSGVKGAEGVPGDVVTASEKQAQVWLDEGVAEVVERPVERATASKPRRAEKRG